MNRMPTFTEYLHSFPVAPLEHTRLKNKMKKSFLFLLSLLTLSLTSCKDDDSTTIEGQLINDATNEGTGDAVLILKGHKNTGLTTPDRTVSYHEIRTDSQGFFSIILEQEEEVSRYSLSVDVTSSGFSGIECTPKDCNSLDPGKKNEITVKAIPEE